MSHWQKSRFHQVLLFWLKSHKNGRTGQNPETGSGQTEVALGSSGIGGALGVGVGVGVGVYGGGKSWIGVFPIFIASS